MVHSQNTNGFLSFINVDAPNQLLDLMGVTSTNSFSNSDINNLTANYVVNMTNLNNTYLYTYGSEGN